MQIRVCWCSSPNTPCDLPVPAHTTSLFLCPYPAPDRPMQGYSQLPKCLGVWGHAISCYLLAQVLSIIVLLLSFIHTRKIFHHPECLFVLVPQLFLVAGQHLSDEYLSLTIPLLTVCQRLAWCGVSVIQVVTIGLRQQPSLSGGTQHIGITMRASKSGELKRYSDSCKARRIDQIKAGLSSVIHDRYIYTEVWLYCLICLKGWV